MMQIIYLDFVKVRSDLVIFEFYFFLESKIMKDSVVSLDLISLKQKSRIRLEVKLLPRYHNELLLFQLTTDRLNASKLYVFQAFNSNISIC